MSVTAADAAGKTFTEVAKLAGEMWRAMSDADKAPFEQLAAEDKLRYQTEVIPLSPFV